MKLNTSKVPILVGPPCVGKSTYLKELDYGFVISSDGIVEILCKRANISYHDFFTYSPNSRIKKDHNKIFKQLVKESKSFEHVVWDLTNLTRKARKRIFDHYPRATFNAVEFEFQGSESLILKRNQQRFEREGKYVDEAVIKDMSLSYEPVCEGEGFTQVKTTFKNLLNEF